MILNILLRPPRVYTIIRYCQMIIFISHEKGHEVHIKVSFTCTMIHPFDDCHIACNTKGILLWFKMHLIYIFSDNCALCALFPPSVPES